MEIRSNTDEGKVVFLRLDTPIYEKLEELRKETGGRGVATVIRQIVETALSEGITVAERAEKPRKTKRAA